MGLLPFFPLASGLLTGKYRRNVALPAGTRLANTQRLADRYLTDRNWQIAEQLGDFAESRGHTMLELAFSWLLAQRPGHQRDRRRHEAGTARSRTSRLAPGNCRRKNCPRSTASRRILI